jgi:hypothetical protein
LAVPGWLDEQSWHLRLVEQSRATAARYANAVVVVSNWRLGHLIDTEILHRGRAEYGKEIVATLSHKLAQR